MTLKTKLKIIFKEPLSTYHYLLGNYRYRLFYDKSTKKNSNSHSSRHKHWLMREHIFQQIKFRIIFMEPECYTSGSCTKCGCMTTALQMCNKSCDGLCYPIMMNKSRWNNFMINGMHFDKYKDIWIYNKKYNTLTMHKPFINNNNKSDYDVQNSKTRVGNLKGR